MEVNFDESFELLDKLEWNEYLSEKNLNSMYIEKAVFNKYEDRVMMYPLLMEKVDELNNKVDSAKISYALCRHYYDKGIPDEPFYISPGRDGQSVQYFPEFKEEHWMRHYWFNHFADATYMKLFSIWDSITEILDVFYCMNIDKNMRFKFRVMEYLKENNNKLWNILKTDVLDEAIYIKTDSYRNSFAHYTGPSNLSGFHKLSRNKEVTIPEVQEDGTIKMITKKAMVLSVTVGDYTNVESIMDNILEFSKFTSEKIGMVLNQMIK